MSRNPERADYMAMAKDVRRLDPALLEAERQAAVSVRRSQWLEQAGLPRRHRDTAPDCSEKARNRAWLHALEKVVRMVRSGFVLALVGSRGSGKTLLAVKVVEQFVATAQINPTDRHTPGPRYVDSVADMFAEIRASFSEDAESDESEVISRFSYCPLLVLDEIQEVTWTDWNSRMLTRIVNKRYQNRLDTLIIGNVTVAELPAMVGPSITSRMQESGGIIVADWGSFR